MSSQWTSSPTAVAAAGFAASLMLLANTIAARREKSRRYSTCLLPRVFAHRHWQLTSAAKL